MSAAIRAEFRKFFTTRLWWGMAIAIFLAGVLFSLLFGFLLTGEQATGGANPEGIPTGSAEQIANSVYTGGLSVGYLLTLTIGVLQIGSEYRHKTISGTFLAVPKRAKVMLAKIVALLGLGALYGLISLAGSVITGAIVLNARGFDPFPSTEVLRTLALSLLVLGLWALIGLGAGILIPNQVAALLIAVGVAWIVEPLIGFALTFWDWGAEHVAKFLPSSATSAMINAVQNSPDEVRLEWWGGALMLTLYAAVLAGVGSWQTLRRDIT
jgi:ABC-type transport system involved in multi-copper enzyme maturation permease subunit